MGDPSRGRFLDPEIAQVEGLAGLDGELLDVRNGPEGCGVVAESKSRAGDQDGDFPSGSSTRPTTVIRGASSAFVWAFAGASFVGVWASNGSGINSTSRPAARAAEGRPGPCGQRIGSRFAFMVDDSPG